MSSAKGTKSSIYYGVSFSKKLNKYVSAIIINNKSIYLGGFHNEVEAAIAHDNAIRNNGLDRRLNFPDPEPENLIPNTRLIRLTRGKFAIVDEEDFEYLDQWTWTSATENGICYAIRFDKFKHKIPLHRQVMGLDQSSKSLVDHVNHDGLDNRKSNLRLCTIGQNNHNSRPNVNGASKYKGVSLNRGKYWISQISLNSKNIHIGCFDNEFDAAMAYDAKAKELHGEFAYLNFN